MTLDELLVEIGISTDDLTSGASRAAQDVERSLDGIGDAADAVSQDVAQASDRASAALDDVGDAADTVGRDVAQAADTASTALDGVGASAAEAAQGAETAAGQVEGSFRGIAAAAAGAAVGGLFISGLTNAMDAKHATSRLAIQLDLTGEEAERAGALAGKVFTAGFGESIGEVHDALGGVAQAMGGMGKVTDAELDSMTRSALMLASTFEIDLGEAATAAGQLINQGLVKDGKEAFDVLTRAAQTLPKSMAADIPTIVADYGKHFARVGLDAQTAFGMISQYVKAGGRDIDQAGDVIHEFARITSEESDRAAAAFKLLGLDAGKMLSDIGKGGEPARAALQKTLTAVRNIKDPMEQSAIAVELFGDMAGEGADAVWAMDPATAAATSGMNAAAGAAEKATGAMAATQSLDSIWRTLSTTLGEALGPALEVVAKFLAENPELVKVLVPVLLGLAVAIGIAVIAQWAWNAALFAFPGTWIILAIMLIIAAVVLVVMYWDEIVAATRSTWDSIVEKLGGAWTWIKETVGAVWDWVSSKISEAWRAITGWIKSGVDTSMRWIDTLSAIPGKIATWFGQMIAYVRSLPGRIGAATAGMWDGIKSAFRGALNWIIGRWNNFSFSVGGGSFMGVSIPRITISTPDIPYLAEGGITTGPTLAMIGEGREDEAVLPLSRLDGMLRGVARSVQDTGGDGQAAGGEARVVIDVTGADREMKALMQRIVRVDGRGSAQTAFGQRPRYGT
ncbi:phage tail tape measure protein [Streptomyces fradiae]|uniref:phage tail tape measure protein n=1 Tax=Streptomyces fradiae TaxID=1906 RepID=UPI0029439B3C|nr:phage tail tape measure protein [Streptomyces fradiae]WOI58600.1 phage tail tape measure protein [Streptomyces fradiae]